MYIKHSIADLKVLEGIAFYVESFEYSVNQVTARRDIEERVLGDVGVLVVGLGSQDVDSTGVEAGQIEITVVNVDGNMLNKNSPSSN